ncbi:Csu type fimbrial protein [Achromobacter sp. NCFB-sbj8-Ac1-l]|uniref:Csu type fimbrial protein n=1 Tax=unclassified Achromobacter TaxID=2626865 RepID=UPI004046E2C0
MSDFIMPIFFQRVLLFVALLAGLSAVASADNNCQGGAGAEIKFGSFYSYELYKSKNSRQFDSSFQCNFFSLINLGTNSQLKVTAISSNNGAMTVLFGLGRVPYKLYSDAKGTVSLPFGQQVSLPQGGLSFLGLGGSVGGNVQLFLETQAGANPTAATYRDTITLHWEWGYCSLGALGLCAPFSWHSGTASSIVNVSLDVRKSCAFNGGAATLNFGAQPLVSRFKPSTANVGLYCTVLVPFKISIGEGENAVNGTRRMKGAGGNYIEYQLYQAGTDKIMTPGVAIDGVGLGNVQTFTVEGRINGQQGDVPVGEYSDHPIMLIEY